MPVDLNDPNPIDPNETKFRQMLTNLQGNILKGHGRDHSVHVFVQLNPGDPDAARSGLGAVARRVVTSAWQQHRETEQFQDFDIPGEMFGNMFLTKKGYLALGFTDDQIEAAFPGDDGQYFRDGMQAHAEELKDPPKADLDKGYQAGDIDAMILLADDDETFLRRQARTLIKELETFATVLVVERGDALRTDSGEGIEHFGYVDGRSQPIYFTTDLKDKDGKSKEGDTDKWNPVERLSIVLVPDRNVEDGVVDAFGSYFVFRKLEQDVRRFKMREQDLADELGFKGREERDRAGAMAVGRFEDGTPLALSQTDGFIPVKENNFNYDHDRDGAKCPFHAHIRKCNPRGDTVRKFGVPEEVERRHRITRRGIPYGKRNRKPDAFQALEDLPTEGVGLLFMCFQSSIAEQFAFIQRDWVNNENFLNAATNTEPRTGVDPVIGQMTSGTQPASQTWPKQWGWQPDPSKPGIGQPPETKPFSFHGFVKLKGGEFFFAPSVPFLRSL